MSFAEKLLLCVDCAKIFTFTVEEQELHASHGFINVPRRCTSCRKTRKTERNKNESDYEDSNSQRPMFPVTCTQCGKTTRVPFQPREGKPAYCSNCYIKTRVGR
jgi:CxxC-x17-CxxC domain-containing protein